MAKMRIGGELMNNILDTINKLKIKKYTTYGDHIAKVDESCYGKKHGKLILVTAISPTKTGNGKTTVSIGLADSLNQKYNAVLSLREPSMGPVFGAKGGAAGGGKCLLVPATEIDLHFTGDMHAITSANNLICACIDNILYQGNSLNINPLTISIKRCVDMNDRALRDIMIGDEKNRRREHFIITSATELMAILCLSKDFEDLKQKISQMVVAKNYDGKHITVNDLGIVDAVAGLFYKAISPNLVTSLAGTPAFVHGGPFANIAHGASSIIATKMAMNYGDYAITEAGFGADLGAEKFFDVVCPKLGKYPDCVVLIATMPALKTNGNGDYKVGLSNLQRHIDNLKNKFGANVVVTVNKFIGDNNREINDVISYCNNQGVRAAVCTAYSNGARGAEELANLVVEACKSTSDCHSLYSYDLSISKKIEKIAKETYGAGKIVFSEIAQEKLKEIKKSGYDKYPVIIAKTQYSFSCDDKLLGAPKGFEFLVNDVELRTGAGFVVAVCGKQLLMPALAKHPNANKLKLKGKMLQDT